VVGYILQFSFVSLLFFFSKLYIIFIEIDYFSFTNLTLNLGNFTIKTYVVFICNIFNCLNENKTKQKVPNFFFLYLFFFLYSIDFYLYLQCETIKMYGVLFEMHLIDVLTKKTKGSQILFFVYFSFFFFSCFVFKLFFSYFFNLGKI
jgi:hypothetical protein